MTEPILGFLRRLPSASARVLLTDYDGTLAPFREDRDRAHPYPGVAEALARIARTGTRTVVVTGRPARVIPRLMPMEPRLEIWGSHGLERWWPDGRHEAEPPSAAASEALRSARNAAESGGWPEWLEDKPAGLALHWRGRDERDARKAESVLLPRWRDVAEGTELEVLRFDGGLELRSTLATKARAVEKILEEAGRGAAVAYLGDDTTDEDAFRALRGHGLGILVREEPRDTLAEARIRPPEELIELLERWAEACGAEP